MFASEQPPPPPPCGVLHVDKPRGCTSRDVVNRVQRLVGTNRVGHAGTLDPLATGVLLVCVGKATRLIDYTHQMQKQYRGTFLLGRTSDTEDIDGQVSLLPAAPEPSAAEVAQAASQFLGETMQRPPIYSALKVAGRRAYKLARAGRPVTLEPRKIVVHAIEVVAYEYPQLTLDITCGSGTYVRSIGRDLAERLGTGAVMSALVRTRIGAFDLADACDLTRLRPEHVRERLQPLRLLTTTLPSIELSTEQVVEIANGRYIELLADRLRGAQHIAAHGPDGELHSILQPRGANQFGARLNLLEVPGV